MAHAIHTQKVTPADELRNLLNECEKRAVNIRGSGADQARELLQWLDLIHERLPELEASGLNMQPERVRWEAVLGAVRRHEKELRRELEPLGGLESLRRQLPAEPDPDRWWWWLDQHAAERTRRRLSRGLITVIALVALVLAARWLFNYLFPVDPNVLASYDLQTEAERLIEEGNYEQAVQNFQEALTYTPDDEDPQIWLVALYDVTGRSDESRALLDKLLTRYDPSTVYAELAQRYYLLQQYETSLAYAQKAIDANPENPEAYLAAGGAYEALGDFVQAMASFEQASDIAERLDMPELQALARVRMAELLQRRPVAPFLTPEG
ncbi:MAG: hypothetical protein D6775_11755 [Caldilineae bacterium]|nr:MAG: hypothetical protein D6775_11755 [Caldilineae bacterium]